MSDVGKGVIQYKRTCVSCTICMLWDPSYVSASSESSPRSAKKVAYTTDVYSSTVPIVCSAAPFTREDERLPLL